MSISKTILPVFILLLVSPLCFPQCIDVTNVSRNRSYAFLNASTQVLQANSLISLDSVLQPASQQKFSMLNNGKILFRGYDPYYYWYRFTLCNRDTVARDFVLLFGGLGIRKAALWKGSANAWAFIDSSGYQYPFQSRPYPYVHYAFPVTVEANASPTFYVQLDGSHAYKAASFVLIEPYKMKRIEHRFYFLFGIFTGILSLFFVLNLYLFFTLQEKINLWYAFYILTMLFFLLKNEGLDSEFLGLDSYKGYRSTYMASVADLSVFLLMQFVQIFLINLNRSKWLYTAFRTLKWSMLIIAVTEWCMFYFQPFQQAEQIVFNCARALGLLSYVLIAVCCIYSFRKGFKPSLFLLIGQSVFFVGGFLRSYFLEADSVIFPPSLFEIGLLIEVVIISYGLMYRYSRYKKEKEEYKKRLEWHQTQVAQQMILTQEAEQKRIAEDLHDEIGGNLAAMKMTLQSFALPPHQMLSLTQLIDQVTVNARNIAHNLMPPEFEQTKMEDLLSNYYQQLTKDGAINFQFFSSGSNHHFTKQDELIIYRIVTELTNNIIRHSKATEATLQLVYHKEELSLTAEDNGIGIQQEVKKGIGLKNIRSRVDFLNGVMSIDTSSNGSIIIIHIPYKK